MKNSNASNRHETAEEDFAPDNDSDERASGFLEVPPARPSRARDLSAIRAPAPGKQNRGRLTRAEMIATRADGPELASYILKQLASAEDGMEKLLDMVPDKSLFLVLEERPRFARYAGDRGQAFIEGKAKK